ncbi:aryl-sulfate sulfotransferase [Halorussus aquaticus]|nr:aryl-sulfate sulfotransferase [Halorussus aquaticus]
MNRSGILNYDAPSTNGITVAASDYYGRGRIIAFAPNGSVMYYNRSYSAVADIDRAHRGNQSITYVGKDHSYTGSQCSADKCTLVAIQKVNITTGDSRRLYSVVHPYHPSGSFHDVDRINETHFLFADIMDDSIYIVNTSSGNRTWEWDAEGKYPKSSGGTYGEDWTHLNDVEMVNKTTFMASLRNHDRVVFINRQNGVLRNWTLGEEDNYSILYEQHNPDFIPASKGGPAILVADSENGRVIEYQRKNGNWQESWRWHDTRMQWPRDADRLPNGHTLIADTNGDRLLEVNQQGEIVWSIDYPGPYDVERLSAPAESSAGPSASSVGLTSRTPTSLNKGLAVANYHVKSVVPSLILNATLYALPPWASPVSGMAILTQSLLLVLWIILESGNYIIGIRL